MLAFVTSKSFPNVLKLGPPCRAVIAAVTGAARSGSLAPLPSLLDLGDLSQHRAVGLPVLKARRRPSAAELSPLCPSLDDAGGVERRALPTLGLNCNEDKAPVLPLGLHRKPACPGGSCD